MFKNVMAGIEPMLPQTEWILSHAPNGGKPLSLQEGFKLNISREAFRTKILEHWNNTSKRTASGRPVDVVLSPV
jgi:amidase